MISARFLLIALALGVVSCKAPVSGPPPARAPALARVPTPAQAIAPAPGPAPAPAPTQTLSTTLTISEENAELLQGLENYPDLEVLSISCLEDLQALPDSIGQLTKLKELRIDNGNGCSMNPVLPESIGDLHFLETLILYGAQDPRNPGPRGGQPAERHKFPRSMSQLKNLTTLDLGRNGLKEIPLFVKDLPKLRLLKFEFNNLNNLPEFLNTLPKLTSVTLGNNCGITGDKAKKKDLQRRFPKIAFDFNDEYDCSGN